MLRLVKWSIKAMMLPFTLTWRAVRGVFGGGDKSRTSDSVNKKWIKWGVIGFVGLVVFTMIGQVVGFIPTSEELDATKTSRAMVLLTGITVARTRYRSQGGDMPIARWRWEKRGLEIKG